MVRPVLMDGRDLSQGWAYEHGGFETVDYVAYNGWRRRSCIVEAAHNMVHCTTDSTVIERITSHR
jgi:hypothetical protein